MTEATARALQGLRDLSTLQWYVIPLLAIVFYIYTLEIARARKKRDWSAVIAGAAVFGADFLNETWNGWFMVLSGRSALWTAPGPTALRTTIGWNIEIMFMFAILGIIWRRMCADQKGRRILGLDERWFYGILISLICVAIEAALNAGGHLVWEYPFWERTALGLPLIFLVGYFWFFAWAIFCTSRKNTRSAVIAVSAPYVLAIVMNIAAACLGWRY